MLLMCHGHQDQRKGLPSFSPRLSMQLQPRTPFEDPRRVHRRRNVGRRPRNILGKKPNMICIKERLDIIKQISTRIDLAASRAILIYFPTRFRPSYESLKSRPSRWHCGVPVFAVKAACPCPLFAMQSVISNAIRPSRLHSLRELILQANQYSIMSVVSQGTTWLFTNWAAKLPCNICFILMNSNAIHGSFSINLSNLEREVLLKNMCVVVPTRRRVKLPIANPALSYARKRC